MHAPTFPRLFYVAIHDATLRNCSVTLHETNCLKPVSPLCSQPQNTFQINSANDGCKSWLFEGKKNSLTPVQVAKYQVYQITLAHQYKQQLNTLKLFKCNDIADSLMRSTTQKLLLFSITYKG